MKQDTDWISLFMYTAASIALILVFFYSMNLAVAFVLLDVLKIIFCWLTL